MVSLLFCFTSRLVLRPQINTKCFYLCLLFARLLLLVPPPFLPLGLPPLHRFLFFFFVSSSAPSSFLFIKQLLSIFCSFSSDNDFLCFTLSCCLLPLGLLYFFSSLFSSASSTCTLSLSSSSTSSAFLSSLYSPDSYTLLYITSSSSPTSYIFTFSSSFSPIFHSTVYLLPLLLPPRFSCISSSSCTISSSVSSQLLLL